MRHKPNINRPGGMIGIPEFLIRSFGIEFLKVELLDN